MNRIEAKKFIHKNLECDCGSQEFTHKDKPDKNRFDAICARCGVIIEIAYEKEEKVNSLDHHLNRINFHIGYAVHAMSIECYLGKIESLMMMRDLLSTKDKIIQFLEKLNDSKG